MVSPEGACAAYYNYGRFARERRGGVSVAHATVPTDREQRVLEIIETARAQAAEVPGRAHHDGPRRRRQGDADADRGRCSCRPSPRRRSRALADAGTVVGRRRRARDHHRQLRRQADPLPRRLDRRAGRQRHRQRPRHGRRAAARAEPVDGARGGPRRPTSCAPRSRRSPRPPRRPGVEIVAGDTKVVERGHADSMYLCTTGIGQVDPRAALSPAGLRPGDRILVSGSIGEHGTAIMLARGEFDLDADGRVRHALAVAGRRRAARRGRARTCAACATRRAAASRRC